MHEDGTGDVHSRESVVDGDRRDTPPAGFWANAWGADPWFVIDLEQTVNVTFIELFSRGPSWCKPIYKI